MVVSVGEFIRLCEQDEETGLLGVIGNPIAHTRSPHIHSLFINETKQNARYLAILASDMAEFHHLLKETLYHKRCLGFNVTIPFKEYLLSYQPDLITQEIGAGNTLVKQVDHWAAHNTDWQGFLNPIVGTNIQTACVLGWGGSARAVVYALKSIGCKVTVVSRRQLSIPGAEVIQSDYETPIGAFSTPDLIVNATPVGMSGTGTRFNRLFLQSLGTPILAYDLIYKPPVTPFLAHFSSVGSDTLNGAPMLVSQASAAFSLWFGRQPSRTVCEQAEADILAI